MGNCRIIASFSDEDIDVIVGVIAESMGWKVSKSGSTYTFDGQGCE
jgi:Mg2+/Co2+ transporter CorC